MGKCSILEKLYEAREIHTDFSIHRSSMLRLTKPILLGMMSAAGKIAMPLATALPP